MFWDENKIGADQPIADKIRRHFLNQNAYRQPTADIDSDSSAELDLSESFEQILERRRAELNHKHTQTGHQPSGSAAGSSRASTSVLNRLLTDIDLNDGGANDATLPPQRSVQPADDETQLQDVLEPSMFDMLSPCKRVGLLRPSTVLEDSFGELENYSAASSIAERTANDVDKVDTSYATAQSKPTTESGHSTSFATATPFSRQSTASTSTLSANFTRDSLATSMATASVAEVDDDSLNVPPTEVAAFDDTLEVVEYDHSASKYVLKPVVARRSTPKRQRPATDSESSASSDSSDSEADKSDVVLVSDSDPDTSYHTANTNVKTERDSSHHQSDALFPKARSFYADESLDEMARDILLKHDQSGVVISLDESDEKDDEADEAEVAARRRVDDEMECRSSLYSERDNDNANDANDDTGSTISVGHSVSQREPNLGGADGDCGDESFALDAFIPDTFNDTIERMDYLMELGRKIQLKEQRKLQAAAAATASTVSTGSSSSTTSSQRATPTKTPTKAGASKTPSNVKTTTTLLKQATSTAAAARNSPRPLAKTAAPTLAATSSLKKTVWPAAVLARNSPILKAKTGANNSPAAAVAKPLPMFKKPTHLAPTSTLSASKLKTTPQPMSRIPKPSSSSGGRLGPSSGGKAGGSAFDYVVSPIGAYIAKRAPNPMVQNVHIVKDFLDSTYCASASKELDFTLPTADVENAPPNQQRCRLPQKAYVAADRKQIIDKRRLVMPGGPSVQKLVGTVPTVFTHHGQFNSSVDSATASSANRRADILGDDSFNDMSLAIGDVSVQVVQDPKR